MRLIDVVNAPWAITPEMLAEIQNIYVRHLRGDKIDLDALSAATGISFANDPKGYEVIDGVAVLPIDGVMAKRMNLMTKVSGGTSSQYLQRDLNAALADRTVEAVVLATDSPGGTVDGTPELAQAIYRARGVKPIIACTDGQICSAAYWAVSAADAIYISSQVAMVGSIGVLAQHLDKSVAQEKSGVKVTDVFAGKYKRIASENGPLTPEGLAYMQDRVDYTYSIFVNDVATHRGVTPDTVLADMADGRVFQGNQAIEAGLVDGVATMSETIAMAKDMAKKKTSIFMNRPAGVAVATNHPAKESTMDIATLRAEHPELVQAIIAEATAGHPEALAAARAEGATAENQRIKDVRAQALPGHEALVEALAFDGKSTAADAALAIVNAEKNLRAGALSDLDAGAGVVVPAIEDDPAIGKTMKRSDFNALGQDARRAFLAEGGKILA